MIDTCVFSFRLQMHFLFSISKCYVPVFKGQSCLTTELRKINLRLSLHVSVIISPFYFINVLSNDYRVSLQFGCHLNQPNLMLY